MLQLAAFGRSAAFHMHDDEFIYFYMSLLHWHIMLDEKQAFRSLVPTQCVLCCALVPLLVRLHHISDSNLISRPIGMGEVQRSQQTEVRTQEREAECNRGRTTCRPAWDVPIGSSRSGGPESLPAGPACGFCGVVETKCIQAWKNNVKNQRCLELLMKGSKP